MAMKWGVPYSMVNTVIDFEPDRRIAWQTRGPGPLGKVVGGRIWRYDLEPTDDGTLVRETWDISQESPLSRFSTRRMAGLTRRNMEQTLARIEELVTG
jgi:carbon monoxide dehydrogenase subunit G